MMLKRIMLIMAVSLMLVVPAYAKDAPERTVVQVNGSSQKEVMPDVARIYVSINTVNSNLEQAKSENTHNLDKVLAVLKDRGVTDRQIKTDTYQIDPMYNYEEGKLQTLKGYRIINRLVITDSVENVGVLINEVTRAGANEISSIRFEAKNEKEIKNDALQEAVKDALKKAEVIAEALNKKVVNVKLVNESGVFYNPIMMEARSFKAADSSAPNLPGGKVTVGANVQVNVELGD